MVRGRLYISGDAPRSRRAASVPVEDFSAPVDTSVLHKAHVISSHAVQDADAMRAASRQHDINFLNDISNKLAATQQPQHYHRDSAPVYIGSRYPPPPNHTTVTDYRRRSIMGPPQVTDYEVSNYLSGGYRGVRASPSRAPSVPRWTHAPSPSRSRAGSVSRGPVYSREKLAPYEDVVVGVAHTSLYGDIVIGIPYNKRHMFDMDTDNPQGGNNYRVYRPSAGSRHSISSTSYPSIGTVVVAPGSRRASISVPHNPISSSRGYRGRSVLNDDIDEYLSSTPRFRSTGYHHNYDQDLNLGKPPISSSYGGRASSVQRQLNGVSDYKPTVSYSAPLYSSGSGAPYTSSLPPASSSAIPPKAPRNVSRPPVSEARRKVRDLLCKSKNDPHYFDGY